MGVRWSWDGGNRKRVREKRTMLIMMNLNAGGKYSNPGPEDDLVIV